LKQAEQLHRDCYPTYAHITSARLGIQILYS